VARAVPRTIVGVDEAGRGAWIGPLVVGAFAISEDRLPDLRACGARDSKVVAPAERERIHDLLPSLGVARSLELPPPEIDRHASLGHLNALEARAFGEILAPFSPAVAYVDACDTDAARFGRRVSTLAGPGIRIIARHRADERYPVVGAASIVAKVRRDRAVRELGGRLGVEVGSGYPSDARTIRAVRSLLPPGSARPEWLRASWATTSRVLRGRAPRTLAEFAG
jgi:ribonuclease HII